jgi:hypothetical protein
LFSGNKLLRFEEVFVAGHGYELALLPTQVLQVVGPCGPHLDRGVVGHLFAGAAAVLVVLDLEVRLNINQVAIMVSLGPMLQHMLALLDLGHLCLVGTEDRVLGARGLIGRLGDRRSERHCATISLHPTHNY